MTKQTMKELVKHWNSEMSEAREESKQAFNELMELNGKYGDGHKWCHALKNYEGLSGTRYEIRAEMLITKYYEGEGQFKALIRFLDITNNFNL